MGTPMVFRTKPRSIVTCSSCGRRRRAAHLVIQVFYDIVVVTCRACPTGGK